MSRLPKRKLRSKISNGSASTESSSSQITMALVAGGRNQHRRTSLKIIEAIPDVRRQWTRRVTCGHDYINQILVNRVSGFILSCDHLADTTAAVGFTDHAQNQDADE